MHRLLGIAAMIVPAVLAPCALLAGQASPLSGSPRSLNMTPSAFQALPSAPADHRIAYGDESEQYGDLRLPAGVGPHPVVVLIHGGNLRADYATLKDMAPMADALKAKGIATWNIEFRRLGNPGGGWPGTYLDIGRAVDQLRPIAAQYALDLDTVVVVGHSSGAQQAVLAASRTRLPRDSPLFTDDPLPIKGVVNLAGYGDMQAFGLMEMPSRPAVPQRLIWGGQDSVTPVRMAKRHVQAAKRTGAAIRLVVLPHLGHFEIADPGSPAWPAVIRAIESLQRPD